MWKRLALASVAVLGLTAGGPAANAANFLLSGGNLDSSVQSFLSTDGFPSTLVDPGSLSSTSLAGFTGVWIGWATSYANDATLAANLNAFMMAGGDVFLEPLTNLNGDFAITDLGGSGNSVHVSSSFLTLMSGLDDGGLSGWNSSYHDTYSPTGSFTCVAVGVDSGGDCVTMVEQVGAGFLTVTGQDPDFHSQFGAGPTGSGSPKMILAENALTLAVPEPTTLAILGASVLGIVAARRRRAA
jgi:hypothetical protein